MTPRTGIERADAQAGLDGAGTPGLGTLLVAVLGAAVAWSLHLLGSYALLTWGCSSGWAYTRPALTLVSAATLVLTLGSGWLARRHWRIARALDRPTDDAWDARMGERTARVSLMMVVGLVASIVFSLGVVYEALAIWLVPLCEAGIPA